MPRQDLQITPYPNKITLTGGSVAADVTPELNYDEGLPKEGYRLELAAQGIKITAADESGAFYARQSLKQLSFAAQDGQIPCCVIEDAPRFEYRGFMLDCARHMTAIEDIKKLIDAMALMKLNYFHWHLTDDQGWRVHIHKYPRLTEIGSFRKGSHFGHESTHSEEVYGGHYTHDELREIIAYCAERHITVVPELDLPGHTTCAIAAHPELSCTGLQLEVGTKQGIYKDILCVGKDEVLQFVYDVLEEFCSIFPGEYFHIGGDEAPKKRWRECEKCQQRMKDEGLENEQQLQGWFNKKIAAFLAERGKKTIVWNEGLYSGKMGDEVIAQRWFDPGRFALRFANKGGKVIMSEEHSNYLDYPYGRTPLKKTYKYNALCKGLSDEGKANVIGVEAPCWTEHMRDFTRVGYMVFPRLCALAENGWTPEQAKDYKGFMRRLPSLMRQLHGIGITTAAPRAWNPPFAQRIKQTLQQAKGIYRADYPCTGD